VPVAGRPTAHVRVGRAEFERLVCAARAGTSLPAANPRRITRRSPSGTYRPLLDIRRIRQEPDAVKAGIARRGQDTSSLDEVIELDRRQRELAQERDRLRNEIGSLSKQVGGLRRDGKVDEAEAVQARSRELGADEKTLAAEADALSDRIRELLLRIPNLPADDCPDGDGEADNVVLRTHGRDPADHAEHQRVPHWEIGEQLGILDVERGARCRARCS
jgi:seryl-tRNA synthetase